MTNGFVRRGKVAGALGVYVNTQLAFSQKHFLLVQVHAHRRWMACPFRRLPGSVGSGPCISDDALTMMITKGDVRFLYMRNDSSSCFCYFKRSFSESAIIIVL